MNDLSDEDFFSIYEKELDNDIKIDNYLTKDETKQLIRYHDRVKIIKKVLFKFKDGNSRMLIFSKTIQFDK